MKQSSCLVAMATCPSIAWNNCPVTLEFFVFMPELTKFKLALSLRTCSDNSQFSLREQAGRQLSIFGGGVITSDASAARNRPNWNVVIYISAHTK